MPNCFMFQRKNDPTHANVKFVEIDEEMCKDFDVPCDPKKYYMGWYDSIGFALAVGMSLEQIRDKYKEINDPEGVKITEWLIERFTTDAYYAPRSITG